MNTEDRDFSIIAQQGDTIQRWRDALDYYSSQVQAIPASAITRTTGRVYFSCVIDVSGSMEGTKLNAVKMGLCAIVASLDVDDMINITSFSDRIRPVTAGFVTILEARRLLPELLVLVEASGSTSMYDATCQGIMDLREKSDRTIEECDGRKYVLVVLTDGEDSSSRRNPEIVRRYLEGPGFDRFMYVLIAVEMQPRQEAAFESWVAMRHCKQMSVSVRTGARLVQIFKESLIDRVLLSEANSNRFYNLSAEVPVYAEEGDLNQLSQMLHQSLSTANNTAMPSVPYLSESLLRSLDRSVSASVSRAGSENGDETRDNADEMIVQYYESGQYSPIIRRESDYEYSRGRQSPTEFDSFATTYSPVEIPPACVRAASSSVFSGVTEQARLQGLIVDEIENGGLPFGHTDPPIRTRSRSNSVNSTSSDQIILNSIPTECICPISQELMDDPVVCSDGHTYSRSSIQEWFRQSNTSPLTGQALNSMHLVPNHVLRSLIESLNLSLLTDEASHT